ncbi:FG-GAP-like repeat-containing protein [bacterium]|nr:FG-GAP-like repeat-containing protein [bacterium]
MRKLMLLAVLFFVICSLGRGADITWAEETNAILDQQRAPLFWRGGLMVSICFGDVDNDGDPDCFIGDRRQMAYFRNDGSARSAEFTVVSQNVLGDSGVDNYLSPTLGDLDGDGDLDMVVGRATGSRIYFNTGTPANPVWTSSVSVPGIHPELVDFNGDGLLDLATGDDAGLHFYPNTGTKTNPQFGDESSIPVSPTARLKVSNERAPYPRLCDVDGDGDYDLFVGFWVDNGYFDSSYRFYRNNGTASSPSFVQDDSILPANATKSSFWSMAVVDLDGDRDFEFLASTYSGKTELFENIGTPTTPLFEQRNRPFTLDVFDVSKPELADMDGDGDLDLLVGGGDVWTHTGGSLYYFENIGNPLSPNWRFVTSQYGGINEQTIGSRGWLHPAVADFDGDGNQELFVTACTGGIAEFKNEGTPQNPQWTLVTTQFMGIQGGDDLLRQLSFPDLNGDGRPDLVMSQSPFSGWTDELPRVWYYQNIDGTSVTAPVELINHNLIVPPTVGGAQSAGPTFSDVDHDGDLDLILGAAYFKLSDIASQINYFENTGTAQSYQFTFRTASMIPNYNFDGIDFPVAGDLNGDGNDDLLIGGYSGGIRCYVNMAKTIPVSPRSVTLTPGSSHALTTTDTTGEVTWRFVHNRSGATIDQAGAGANYTAGAQAGVIDVIEAVDTSATVGRVYVNVVSTAQLSASGKAVIMAGRQANDGLWPSTNNLAHFIYRALLHRGFSKQNVHYLNCVPAQDVDGDGNAGNDIAAASTLANFTDAMNGFAAGSPNLFVYLIDHGDAAADGTNGFVRCNESEVLYASQLDAFLDDLQANHDVTTVTLVVDCCRAGSFLQTVSGAPAGKARIVITSTRPTQAACFSAGGLISFTNSMMTAVYSGMNLEDAFKLASGAMDRYQQPGMDDDGDGVYDKDFDGAVARRTHVGATFIAGADRPQIGNNSPNQFLTAANSPVTIWASNISSAYPIKKVWATVSEPGMIPASQLDPSQPVTNLTVLNLAYNAPLGRYEATSSDFNQLGTYAVNLYAEDIWGGVSYPKQTYVNQTASDERLIIVCGDGAYDSNSPWANSNYLANEAYQTALARWFTAERVTYLSSGTDAGVDQAPTRSNLQSAIAAAAGASKLTVYLVGGEVAGHFDIDGDGIDGDDVLPADLKGWIDTLQNGGSTMVTVILEFNRSGAWLAALTPPAGKPRITIASCGALESSWCEEGGMLSFSQYFFNRIFNGINLRDAFFGARNATRTISAETQNAQMDDDGSGVSDWRDGALAATTYLGAAFITGADLPAIGDFAVFTYVPSGQGLLWASGVQAAAGINEVFAYVIRPGATPIEDRTEKVNLAYNAATSRWEAAYSNFETSGVNTVIYYVRDNEGQLSEPYQTLEMPPEEDDYDRYYSDDTPGTLNYYNLNYTGQVHNFWKTGDEDWCKLIVNANHCYSINITGQASHCDAKIEVYRGTDLSAPIITRDDNGPGGPDELISWWSGETTGTMLVRVTQSPRSAGLHGENTTYTLAITDDMGANNGIATIIGSTCVKVGWSTTDGIPTGARGFMIQRSTAEAPNSYAPINTEPILRTGGFTEMIDSGLAPISVYYYRILIMLTDGSVVPYTPLGSNVFYVETKYGGPYPESMLMDGMASVSIGSGPVDMGSIVRGGPALTKTFTLYNSGVVALNTSGLTISSPFVITEGLSASIPAGGYDTFTVSLPTGTAGTFTGTIQFTSNDIPRTPYHFTVMGRIDPIDANLIWVKFDYTGTELGTEIFPFNTLTEGIDAVNSGGTVRIFSGATAAPIRITKPARIESHGGTATIGR